MLTLIITKFTLKLHFYIGVNHMQFDKNISIPAKKGGGYPKQYFFELMEVGDSQEFPIGKRASINSRRVKAAKNTGFTYHTKTIGNSVRIWRIK